MGETTSRPQTIAVIGQGYVGLPLALLFVRKGFSVYGIDIDAHKIATLLSGESYLPDVPGAEVSRLLSTGRFHPTTRFELVNQADAIIICVPTPLDEAHHPDISYLESALDQIGNHLRPGQLVMLESSTYPGTTRDFMAARLERASGLVAGKDIHIGYSPERIDPGNKQFPVETIPKVVSGLTDACLQAVKELYSQVFDRLVPVSSPEVAEFTKLLENSHRFINISFMNEIADICDKLNIDVWEAVDAAKTKPFGFTPYYPGPGIGGHCIPVDPLYLQWKAERAGRSSMFIQLADELNRSMPKSMAERVHHLLKSRFPNADSPLRVLVYGVAYKKDINDVRESPALELMAHLKDMGYETRYHDPYIAEVEIGGTVYRSVELTDQILGQTHCTIIFTDHTQIPLDQIVKHSPIVLDTRNVTRDYGHLGHVYRIGAGQGPA